MAGCSTVEMMYVPEEKANLKDSSTGEENEKPIKGEMDVKGSEELEQPKSERPRPPVVYMVDLLYSDGDEENTEDEFGCHEITKQEFRKYMAQVYASGGFDVELFPKTFSLGMIKPIYEPPEIITDDEETIDEITMASKSAIEKYNHDNRSEYVFVSVVKANMEPVAGFMYYITFKAKLPNEDNVDDAKTFQTKAYFGVSSRPMEIIFVRLKSVGVSN